MGALLTILHGPLPPVWGNGTVSDTESELDARIEALMNAVPAGMDIHAPPLIMAAATRDLETVRRLVKSGDGLNACDDGGRGPLHWAVAVDDEAILRGLLAFGKDSGLDLDAVNQVGCTALHYASVTRNQFAAQLLLEAGASPHSRDRNGHTVLMKAAHWDDGPLCAALLAAGSDPAVPDLVGRTALHLAAAAGSRSVMELLLAAGASPAAADHHGRTPLHCALQHCRLAAAEALLPQGEYTPRVDNRGRTELHWAAANGTPAIVRRLLDTGPPRYPRDKAGMTPLLRALEARNEDIAGVLLDASSGHRNSADLDGMTALHWAARSGLPQVVRRLLKEQFSAWNPDNKGRDALMWAIVGGDNETVAAVMQHSGFRQRADKLGHTALHLAARHGNEVAALRLLQSGARADVVDYQGRTPLALAVHHGSDTVAEALRGCGAQETPINHAA